MLGLYMADVFGFDTLQLGFLLSGQSVVHHVFVTNPFLSEQGGW